MSRPWFAKARCVNLSMLQPLPILPFASPLRLQLAISLGKRGSSPSPLSQVSFQHGLEVQVDTATLPSAGSPIPQLHASLLPLLRDDSVCVLCNYILRPALEFALVLHGAANARLHSAAAPSTRPRPPDSNDTHFSTIIPLKSYRCVSRISVRARAPAQRVPGICLGLGANTERGCLRPAFASLRSERSGPEPSECHLEHPPGAAAGRRRRRRRRRRA
jgi:hypothetical protein